MTQGFQRANGFFLGLLLCAAPPVWAAENHWTGAGGDNTWMNAANWSLGVLPNSAQDVFIEQTSNSVLLGTSADVGGFTLGSAQGAAVLNVSGATLHCHGPAIIQTNSLMNVSGQLIAESGFSIAGTMSVTGATLNADYPLGITVGPTGSLNLGGTESNVLVGTIFNLGTVSCFAPKLAGYPGARLANSNLLTFFTNVSFTFALPGTGNSNFYGALLNAGTMSVPAANQTNVTTVTFGWGLTNSGTLKAGSNAVFELWSGYDYHPPIPMSFQDGTVFDGAGTVRLLYANGDPLYFQGLQTVNGTVDYRANGDGNSVWTGPGLFQWRQGRLTSFTFAPDFHVEAILSGYWITISGACTNQGTFRWRSVQDRQVIEPTANTSFYNYGQFILETNCMLDNYPSPAAFINLGTIAAAANSGSPLLAVYWSFTNQGTIKAETNATLILQASASSTVTFKGGTVFAGPGTVQLESYPMRFDGLQIVSGTVDYRVIGDGSPVWTGPGLFQWKRGGPGNWPGPPQGCTFAADFHVEASPLAVYLQFANSVTNYGTIRWRGPPNVLAYDNSAFYNYGQFILETNCQFWPYYSPTNSALHNLGTILVPSNSGTVSLGCILNFTNRGIIEVQSNSVLQIQADYYGGPVSFEDGTIFNGAGTVRFLDSLDGSGAPIGLNGYLTLNSSLEFAGAYGVGAATWSGPGLFQWKSGRMSRFTFSPGFQATSLTSSNKLICGACTNQGTIRWAGDSSLSAACAASLDNSGLVLIETNGNWDQSIIFNNLPGGRFRQTAGQLWLGTLNNNGLVQLGKGTLISSNFTSGPSGGYQLALGGSAPGTGFGRLNATNLALGGSLAVTLTNGFVPANGTSFVITAGASETGQFANASFPPLTSNLVWVVQYASNSTTLAVVSPPMLTDSARLPNGELRLSLAGPPSGSVEIQASSNLVVWTTIGTATFSNGTSVFTDTDAPTVQRRFYRARLAP